jgi:hypothetical protein
MLSAASQCKGGIAIGRTQFLQQSRRCDLTESGFQGWIESMDME